MHLLNKLAVALSLALTMCGPNVSARADSPLAVRFTPGGNDGIRIPRAVQDDFTLEYWLRTTQPDGGACSTCRWYNYPGVIDAEVTNVTNDFGTSLGRGRILFGTGAPDVTIESGPVGDGLWHHVAAVRVRSTGSLRLYVDGTLVASGTGGTQALNAPPAIAFGHLQTTALYTMDGTLDEVRIWNRALGAQEISDLVRACNVDPASSGLIGYYRFDEGPGTTVRDSSPSNLTGIVFGAPMWEVSTVTPSSFAWEALGDQLFGQRWVHSQAYSAVNQATLLFGGRNASNVVLGDTWLGTGSGWMQVATSGPHARSDTAMAALPHGHILLFGGKTSAASSTAKGDTWEWEGSTWVQKSSTGPAARFGHAMAFDSIRGKVVMFGGINSAGAYLGDTWEWNGSAWSMFASSGPSSRFAHTMAFDAPSGKVLLFGGFAASLCVGDTWAWNGTLWTQVATGGPSPRFYAAADFYAPLGAVVLTGGRNDSQVLADTYLWAGTFWQAAAVNGEPTARWTHAMSFDPSTQNLVATGGADRDSTPLADAWVLSDALFITNQPISQTSVPGSNVSFTFSVVGQSVEYQWRKDGVNLVDGGPINGATSPTLTLTNVQRSDQGDYACVASLSCRNATSNVAELTVCSGSDCDVLYVNAAAAAGGNGLWWGSAFKDIQQALDKARADNRWREVWVAQGTYRPDRGTLSREASFELVSGITILGGFAGFESDASQRDSVAHLTILSGDLGQVGYNSARIVTAHSLTPAAKLAGFTIGSAVVNNYVGVGGAVYAESSQLNINDCILADNRGGTPYTGGGTAAGLIAGAGSIVHVTNCRIVRNAGEPGGYALSPMGEGGGTGWGVICDQSALVLSNCVVAQNTGGSGSGGSCTAGVGWDGGDGGNGGGLSVSGNSTVTVVNSVFTGNGPGGGGSGVYCNVRPGNSGAPGTGGGVLLSESTIAVTNCTLASNSFAIAGTMSGVSVRNSIVWNNGLAPGASVQYSSLSQAYPGTGNLAGDPKFIEMAGPYALRLAADSRCLDAADNTALSPDVLTDLDGENRFINAPAQDAGVPGGSGGTAIADMGAFERQLICIGDYNADGGVDGSDVQAFLSDWESASPAADLNASGGIDGEDVEVFFVRWESGC